MIRFSFTNLVELATVAASTAATNFPASYAQAPERPLLPWKTTVTTESTYTVDLGQALVGPVLVMLTRTNFTAANIQGNTTDSWGAPSVNDSITISRQWLNTRYQFVALYSGFPRFFRLRIPSQTPVDGATNFLLGGIWIGSAVRPPKNILAEVAYRQIRPQLDVEPDHRGWTYRLKMGEPRAALTVTKFAKATMRHVRAGDPGSIPGSGNDSLKTWALTIDAQIADVSYFAFALDPSADGTQGWVMRQANEQVWALARPKVGLSVMELVEAL